MCIIFWNLNDVFWKERFYEPNENTIWRMDRLLDTVAKYYQKAIIVCSPPAHYWGYAKTDVDAYKFIINMINEKRRSMGHTLY